ncbi:bi-domain-containing oxidoreductase [Chloroflexota bacterium]
MKRLIIGPRGEIKQVEIPDPGCNEFGILCQPVFSCISPGTETSGIVAARQSLIKQARQTSNLLPTIWRIILEGRLLDILLRRESLTSPFPEIPGGMGYSSSGVVVEKGSTIDEVEMGDRVACAGSPHSTLIYIPRNLFVKIPDEVSFEEASFVALGSIAMHGVRRARPEFGDTFAVIGMGILGQITAQILKCAGCSVIGIDINDSRLTLAKRIGCDLVVNSDRQNPVEAVKTHTNCLGVDGAIVCAGSKSPDPLVSALEMSRDKGRVILVGAVPINLPRAPLYQKEIDFLISRSYGPGRYQKDYEELGMEYPLEEVRWTEKRNMAEFLRLISEKKIDVRSLITHTFPFDNAGDAYETVIRKPETSMAMLLGYGQEQIKVSSLPSPAIASSPPINVAVVGLGGFARDTHIPNLRSLDSFKLRYAVARKKESALACKQEFGFEMATTSYGEALEDNKVHMVLITTRHNLHASMSIEALEHGKHVFVEKPLGLTLEECKTVVNKVNETGLKLAVGFNRRFSPLSIRAKEIIGQRTYPIMANFRVVSGFTSADNWVYDPAQGGGRILGEACHFIDLLCWLVDSPPTRLFAEGGTMSHRGTSLDDNFVVTMRFADGSVASLAYGDLGNPKFPKERLEIFAGNRTIVINDFIELMVEGVEQPDVRLQEADKGHRAQIIEFARAIQYNEQSQLAMAKDGLRATFLCHNIIESLRTGMPVEIKDDYLEG